MPRSSPQPPHQALLRALKAAAQDARRVHDDHAREEAFRAAHGSLDADLHRDAAAQRLEPQGKPQG